MTQRARPRMSKSPSLIIDRGALRSSEVVYLAVANRKLAYPQGKSYIAYIGTTKNGASRVAGSAVWKASTLLGLHNVHTLEFYIVSCPKHGKHEAWKKLERALLIRFRERFGAVPAGNTHGKYTQWEDELDVFTPARIDRILDYYSWFDEE